MQKSSERGFSAKEVNIIWLLWRQGETLSEIGRTLRKCAGSVFHIVAANGGISPAISLEEREEISRGIAANKTVRAIAASL